MKSFKKILLLLLIFILLIETLFLLLFFNRTGLFISRLPFPKKKFVAQDKFYKFESGPVKIFKRPPNSKLIDLLYLSGTIKDDPYLDEKTQYIILPVTFALEAYKVNTRIVLGFNYSDSLLVLKAVRGIISTQQIWSVTPVKESLRLLKKGYPIIIGIAYQKDFTYQKSLSICSQSCKLWFTKAESYYYQNSTLIKALDKSQKIKESLIVGPAQKLILYEN